MERLFPGSGASSAAFWDSRARRYAARLPIEAARRDPFLRRLRQATGRTSRVIDAGAGTGRFALNLADRVTVVTAVDPSPAMLGVLSREGRRRGLSNVRTVLGRWEDVDVEPAQVVFSSYVLPIVVDAPRFLTKLTAAASDRAFLYLGAFSTDAVLDPLWRHFHGTSRKPGPTYLDAIGVLRQLGISPDVEVVEVANRTRFATIAEAANEYRDYLLLPRTKAVTRELQGLLSSWLVKRDGALAAPLPTVPAAIISWSGQAPRQPAPS